MAVQPWDKGNLSQIESALRDSGLGFGVVNAGDMVRVNIPELTEERRNEYVKLAKEKAEEAKIAIRNARRDVAEKVKKAKTEGTISEDEMYRREEEINKLVENKNKEIDTILGEKEKELREV
jgi:ribosome recycling factor